MATIKEFAALCGCSTQTLRYYDRIGLLKPVKVDPWSSYRYYDSAQAMDFVKIKNLQAADFTIDEIKTLLRETDQQVYEALVRKVEQQRQKLERIQKIQQSYLTEKTAMEKLIQEFCGFLLEQLKDPAGLEEFGLKQEDAGKIAEQIRCHMTQRLRGTLSESAKITVIVDGEEDQEEGALYRVPLDLDKPGANVTVHIGKGERVKEDPFDSENYETLWERSGWEHVYEFLDDIPTLEAGRNYYFCFWLNGERKHGNMSFSLYMLGTMIRKGYGPETGMYTRVEGSSDRVNRFALLREIKNADEQP